MTFEQLVGDALHAADDYQPSADLFAKVQRSIDEDAAHRTRVRKVIVSFGVAMASMLLYIALTADFTDGAITMPFRALEILVTAVMIAVVIAVGPAIRRFGATYESDAFSANPETGRRVLRLLDISYYLIFSAYILITLVFEPNADVGFTLSGWVHSELVRLGGLLLLMGVLHVALLLALPVVGLVFSANQHRVRVAKGYVSTDPGVERIDRVVTVAAWVVAGLAILELLFGVLNVLVLLGAPG